MSYKMDFVQAIEIVKDENLDYLVDMIYSVKLIEKEKNPSLMWQAARNAPRNVAHLRDEHIVQIIDEFQFLSKYIYRDSRCKEIYEYFIGGYLSTAESKIAPLLVSGSWVRWLMYDLTMILPGRFRFQYLENMPEEEAMEMIFKYSQMLDVPVSDETAFILNEKSEGNPFYISALMYSIFKDKDLTTKEGLLKTLEFETLNNRAEIKRTWMEYILTAFHEINDRNAKNIVLYLSQNREREVTRKEIMNKLGLTMTDRELEKKLAALVKADIIDQGESLFRYQGVKDNIFDKVFRSVYEEEINSFTIAKIDNEYRTLYEDMHKKYESLKGKYNILNGYYAEYLIIRQLSFKSVKKNDVLKSLTANLPEDFDFVKYSSVWTYRAEPEYSTTLHVDILARTKAGYSLVCEVKNRTVKPFSLDEAKEFNGRAQEVIKVEKLDKVMKFVFSRKGFTQESESYLNENSIACSSDERWLDV